MCAEDQDRIAVVLVRARNPANIGAVARAMHDLGFRHLRIVNEYPIPFQAAKSAVDASSVLEAAQEFPSLAEAVADCEAVYGTTAVGERVLEHPLHALGDAAAQIAAETSHGQRVALLFGSEKTGLSNDELSHCTALLTIPMNTRDGARHLSMNLGQAAAVCLYTIGAAGGEPVPPLPMPDPAHAAATAEAQERITGFLLEVLERSGYVRRHPANAREPVVRRMVRRVGLRAVDALVWTGVLRQLLHALPEAAPSKDGKPSRGANSEADM